MTTYYNEIDPKAAAWLRELIKQGHIAPGVVDERSIVDVLPSDLKGFIQCHFFAGIGIWSYALRSAGWSDDRPVWTGSCPCQPFSAAGKGGGFDDERHLWPAWHWLIEQRRPGVIFGEQVASRDGLTWLDLVSTDLEGVGYACGPVNLPACGVGAPHIRQRSWFMAHAKGRGRGVVRDETLARSGGYTDGGRESVGLADSGIDRAGQYARELSSHEGEHEKRAENGDHASVDSSSARSLVDASGERCQGRETGQDGQSEKREHSGPERRDGGMANAPGKQCDARRLGAESEQLGEIIAPARYRDATGSADEQGGSPSTRPGPVNGFWRDADWLLCRDGKWRPVEPGTQPLAYGAPARVGRLRGYGNGINAEAAAAVIRAAILDFSI